MYGPSPRGFHATNVILHAAAVLLLFLALTRMTGYAGRSAVVAGLFAWHPLHVESVAWAAERKDVLSGFFWMLTLWTYARYAERPSFPRQLLVIASFALGLMAKPMVVTLPCVLLLLDYWPLRRLGQSEPSAKKAAGVSEGSLARLIAEKLPLFALAAFSCVLTWHAQRHGGAVRELSELPVRTRIENAVVAYCVYLEKAIWPIHLAVLYPHRAAPFPLADVAAAAIVLALITLAAVKFACRCPYLPVGWFWYVGTLVPVIGLVQVGGQSLADRYTYLPLIGIFLLATWGIADLAERWSLSRAAAAGAAAVVVCACLCLSWVQIGYWRDSITLWEHDLRAAEPSALAHGNLGVALARDGKTEEAIGHYRAALKLNADYWIAHYNLGIALSRRGDFSEALDHFEEAVSLRPDNEPARMELARTLARVGRTSDAIRQFNLILENDPNNVSAHCELGRLLSRSNEYGKAAQQYLEALRLDRENQEAIAGLADIAWIRATHPSAQERDGRAAVAMAVAVCRLQPEPRLLDILAAAYAEAGDSERALATEENALAGESDSSRRAAMQARLELYRRHRAYRDAALERKRGDGDPGRR